MAQVLVDMALELEVYSELGEVMDPVDMDLELDRWLERDMVQGEVMAQDQELDMEQVEDQFKYKFDQVYILSS